MQVKHEFLPIMDPVYDSLSSGTEACAASARIGARTLLVTHKKETIGKLQHRKFARYL